MGSIVVGLAVLWASRNEGGVMDPVAYLDERLGSVPAVADIVVAGGRRLAAGALSLTRGGGFREAAVLGTLRAARERARGQRRGIDEGPSPNHRPDSAVIGIIIVGVVARHSCSAIECPRTRASCRSVTASRCPTGTSIGDVQHQPCNEPHDGEVFLVSNYTGVGDT